MRVKVTHAQDAADARLLRPARGRGAEPSTPASAPAAAFVELIQQRLAALHFYMPQTGVYDQAPGWRSTPTTGCSAGACPRRSTGARSARCSTASAPSRSAIPNDGTHVEGNLCEQLLALINGSKVYRIYPISSGKPSTPTILGHFRVYLRTSRATCPTGCTTRTSSSAATRSTAMTRRPTIPPATAACGCRSSTRSRSSTGSTTATWSTSTTL